MISQISPIGLHRLGWKFYLVFICTNIVNGKFTVPLGYLFILCLFTHATRSHRYILVSPWLALFARGC
jgi:hypothetical protein